METISVLVSNCYMKPSGFSSFGTDLIFSFNLVQDFSLWHKAHKGLILFWGCPSAAPTFIASSATSLFTYFSFRRLSSAYFSQFVFIFFSKFQVSLISIFKLSKTPIFCYVYQPGPPRSSIGLSPSWSSAAGLVSTISTWSGFFSWIFWHTVSLWRSL